MKMESLTTEEGIGVAAFLLYLSAFGAAGYGVYYVLRGLYNYGAGLGGYPPW